MITMRLKGGMGNQMFQHAMGRALAERHQCGLAYECSSFNRDSVGRRFSLGLWRGCQPVPTVSLNGQTVVKHDRLPFSEGVLRRIRPGCVVDGYWQTELYFQHLRHQLVDDFQPAQPLTDAGLARYNEIMAAEESCFLTVRRTDYLASTFHGVLGADYYRKALALLTSKVGPVSCYIFSDDPEWCQQNLDLFRQVDVEPVVAGNWNRTTRDHLGREDEELMLMAACNHAILANSSYSWWGAWLGADWTGGICIAPRQWFGPSSLENPRDIVPSRWARL